MEVAGHPVRSSSLRKKSSHSVPLNKGSLPTVSGLSSTAREERTKLSDRDRIPGPPGKSGMREENVRGLRKQQKSSRNMAVNSALAAPSQRPTGDTMIGLALGSPNQTSPPPLAKSPHRNFAEGGHLSVSRTQGRLPDPEPLKPKGGRWRGFGGLFGRKNASVSTAPFRESHQAQQEGNDTVLDERRKRNFSRAKNPLHNSQSVHTEGKETRKDKVENQSFLRRDSSRQNHFQRSPNKDSKNLRAMPPHAASAHGLEQSPEPPPKDACFVGNQHAVRFDRGPLLQVEIPNIELERYSVMFGNVFRAPTPPSLLVRRQANLAELKTKAEGDLQRNDAELPRPGFSSGLDSPAKSPSFSLFPPSPTSSSGNRKRAASDRSPLSRFEKSPPDSSLTSLTMEKQSRDHGHVLVVLHGPKDRSPLSGGQPKSKQNLSSNKISFLDASESESSAASQPSPSAPATAETSQTKDISRNELRDAAEISIARQISVSQRQRQLLVPIVPKFARQPMQPRIEQQDEATVRQSHHLVLEDL